MKKLSILVLWLLGSLLYASNISVSYKNTSDYRLIKEITKNTSFVITESNGDLQNLQYLLKSPSVEAAVVQEDILFDLIKEDYTFREKLLNLTPLYSAAVVILTKKNSNIKSFENLSNRLVAVDVEGSGDYYTFLRLQEKFLVVPEVLNMRKKEAFDILKQGKADALFYIGDLKDIEHIEDYNLVSIEGYNKRLFNINKKSIELSCIEKFLLTTHGKESNLDKKDIRVMIANLLHVNKKDNLCSFNLSNSIIPSLKYLYFVCSQNILKNDIQNSQNQILNHKRTNSSPKSESFVVPQKTNSDKKIKDISYYNDFEDIVIYPQALKKKSFNAYNTSYSVEKDKLNTAVKLIKEELKNNPKARIVILSRGREAQSIKNLNFIYKQLKKSGVSREKLIKKAVNINCTNSCFSKTTIQFKLL